MARDSDMLVRRKEGESASLLRKEGDSRVSLRKPAPSADGVKSGAASLARERATDTPETPAARAMRPRERAALKNACVPSSKNRQIRLSNFDTLMLTASGRAGAVAAGPPAA